MAEGISTGLRAQKKLSTWRTIRQVALGLIAERGFDAVTLDEVAAAARVSRSTLFNYFKSKEAILFDPDPEEQLKWEQFLRGCPVHQPVWVSLQAFFTDYLEHADANVMLQKRLLNANPSMVQARRESSDRLYDFISSWVRERLRVQEGNLASAALLVNLAFTILTTAFDDWNTEDGYSAIQTAVQEHFRTVGQGLLSPTE